MMRGSTKMVPWCCRAVGRKRAESRRLLVTLSGGGDSFASRPLFSTSSLGIYLYQGRGRLGRIDIGNFGCFSSVVDATDVGKSKLSENEEVPYRSPTLEGITFPTFKPSYGSNGKPKSFIHEYSTNLRSDSFESQEQEPPVIKFSDLMPADGLEPVEPRPFINDFTTIMPPEVLATGKPKSAFSYTSTPSDVAEAGGPKPYDTDFWTAKPTYPAEAGGIRSHSDDFASTAKASSFTESGGLKPYSSDYSATKPSSFNEAGGLKPYTKDFSATKPSSFTEAGGLKPFTSDYLATKPSSNDHSATKPSSNDHSATKPSNSDVSTILPSMDDFSTSLSSSPSSFKLDTVSVLEKETYYPDSQFPGSQFRQKNDRFFRSRNNSTVANMLKLLEAAPSESEVVKILEERIPTIEESRVWPWLPLLDALQKGPKPYLALEVFYWKKEKFDGGDPREYAKMISTAGKLNQLELARNLFKEMEEKGLKRTPITCNALISAYSKNDQADQALSIFEEMQEAEDCKPTLVTYNTLISMYSKLSVPQMEKYYNLCKSSGFFPDRVTFNSMIWGFMRGNEYEKMEAMYEQLRESGCKPDPITFSALIIGFSKANSVEKMELAFSHMQEEGIPISTMIAEILTEFYAMDKKFEKMERIMKIVANTPGASCSSRMYGFAIQTYAETGRIKDMEETMDKMFASKRLFTSAKTLESVITAYGSRFNFEGLELVLERIKGMGWAFQHSTFHTLLYEYGKGKEFEKMEEVFKEMQAALDVEPTKETYKILADCYRSAGDGEGLKKTIDRMSAAGFPTKEVANVEVERVWTDDEIFGGKAR